MFLSSYMLCSAHFVGNLLLTNYILRLEISILFVGCRGRKPLKSNSFFRTQNNSRDSTWNYNFLNMILRNPIYTPTIFLKVYQRYGTAYCLPILCQIVVYHRGGMSRFRDTEQEVQCTSIRKLTEQFK